MTLWPCFLLFRESTSLYEPIVSTCGMALMNRSSPSSRWSLTGVWKWIPIMRHIFSHRHPLKKQCNNDVCSDMWYSPQFFLIILHYQSGQNYYVYTHKQFILPCDENRSSLLALLCSNCTTLLTSLSHRPQHATSEASCQYQGQEGKIALAE